MNAIRIAELGALIRLRKAEVAELQKLLPAAEAALAAHEAELNELQPNRAANVAAHQAEVAARGPAPEAAEGLSSNGPTVEQYVEAGYLAKTYPPAGYASKSTQAEIQAAIDAQDKELSEPQSGTAAGAQSTGPLGAGSSEPSGPVPT